MLKSKEQGQAPEETISGPVTHTQAQEKASSDPNTLIETENQEQQLGAPGSQDGTDGSVPNENQLKRRADKETRKFSGSVLASSPLSRRFIPAQPWPLPLCGIAVLDKCSRR